MKKDIQSRTDIELMVNSFYDKVKKDDIIGHFFTEVVKVNWEKHLPVMYNFWENILFHTSNYEGNPMNVHQQLHYKSPVTMQHFQRWNTLFAQTVDALFDGKNAEMVKKRSVSISTVMQINIFKEVETGKFF